MCKQRADQDQAIIPCGWSLEGADGGSVLHASGYGSAWCAWHIILSPNRAIPPSGALATKDAPALPGLSWVPGHFAGATAGFGSSSHGGSSGPALPISCRNVCLYPDTGNTKQFQLPKKPCKSLLCSWWHGRILKTLLPLNTSQRVCYLSLGEKHKTDSSTIILFSSTCWVNKKIKAQVNIHQKVISVCHENNLHL